MSQSAPVVDVDSTQEKAPSQREDKGPRVPTQLTSNRARLAELLSRYGEKHPDVRKLKMVIEEQEAKQAAAAASVAAAPPTPAPSAPPPVKRAPSAVTAHYNPVLESQLRAVDAEIAKHKEEQHRLSAVVATYRAKLDAIPVREQEITALERDYEISKAHYSQLLDKQLSAQTATQLEIRQKGEKFEVLDIAQPAERPSRPNRPLIDVAGSIAGLILGLLLTTGREFFGMSIIAAQDLAVAGGAAVLGVIPVIRTQSDRRVRTRQVLVATAASVVAVGLVGGLFIYFHNQI